MSGNLEEESCSNRNDDVLLDTKSADNVPLISGSAGNFGASISEEDEDLFHSILDEIPDVVREMVDLNDDIAIPVLTFRYFILAILFVIPGAFIDTLNSYRTTSAPYSIFFVQIAAHWLGKLLARLLPEKEINFLNLFKFNLNPGPWSIKETVMVTITANSGATGNLATTPISLAELHFDKSFHWFSCLLFMWAIVFVGYSYAAIPRRLFVYDLNFSWPQALMQTALLKTQVKSNTEQGRQNMRIFFLGLVLMGIWEFFPELFMPMASSLAVLCWVSPHNPKVNFLGSGLGGAGMFNLSLDWSNITSSIMLYPYWVQVIQFLAFVLGAWVLIPLCKFGDINSYKHGLMSNSIFMDNGSLYPVNDLMTSDFQLNETAYELHGPVNMGSQRVWNMFFDYASYASGIVWALFFGFEKYRNSFSTFFHNCSKSNNPKLRRTSKMNELYERYDDVPTSWYINLFLLSFVTLMYLLIKGEMMLPWWCCIIALALGAVIVFPLAWLYALSNFQLAIGTFNELFFGYLAQNIKNIHPVAASIFGAIAGDAWYRAQYHLHCMRLGFYNYIPPRMVFFSQLFGELLGIPMNYLALRWVLNTKRDYLVGVKTDPLHQWTGQTIITYKTNAINYVLLGPSRLFLKYPMLPYGFLLGFIAPILIFLLHKKYPKSILRFHTWNTTVFFSSMGTFYGNVSTGYLSKFLGGTVTLFWAYRYKHSLWKRYNYLLAAAFDTGYNLTIAIIFIIFTLFPSFQVPQWWGNDSRNVERCFAL